MLPRNVCERCKGRFTDEHDLERHQSTVSCPQNTAQSFEGIGPQQEKELHSKRYQDQSTPEEKWVGIFQILFPHVGSRHLPSPCTFVALIFPVNHSMSCINAHRSRLDYDYVTAPYQNENNGLEAELDIILRTKLKDTSARIAKRIQEFWPRMQPGSAITGCKDVSHRLEPDMRRQIRQTCDDEHNHTAQDILHEIIRSFRARKLEISEPQGGITALSENSHPEEGGDRELLGMFESSAHIYDTPFLWQDTVSPWGQEGHCLTSPSTDSSATVMSIPPDWTQIRSSTTDSIGIMDYPEQLTEVLYWYPNTEN